MESAQDTPAPNNPRPAVSAAHRHPARKSVVLPKRRLCQSELLSRRLANYAKMQQAIKKIEESLKTKGEKGTAASADKGTPPKEMSKDERKLADNVIASLPPPKKKTIEGRVRQVEVPLRERVLRVNFRRSLKALKARSTGN